MIAKKNYFGFKVFLRNSHYYESGGNPKGVNTGAKTGVLRSRGRISQGGNVKGVKRELRGFKI